ncbi:sialidase family protein [Raoultella ornithinolytica]|uniref:sialidase family protein n=1 Tax=Raoultella ornithinolytica TaxID=54291 RepID=UPI0038A43079
MGEYNTGNPVPSSAMPDVWDNNATIDEFVNSPELTVITRTGIEHDTLSGIQKKSDDQRVQMAEDGAAVVEETRQNLIPLSRQYMTLAAAQADIANIPDGSTTYVRSADGSSLADEYINNAGTLTATRRTMPSQQTIRRMIEHSNISSKTDLAEFVDRYGSVYARFDKKSDLWLTGLADSVQNILSSLAAEVEKVSANVFLSNNRKYLLELKDKDGKVYARIDNKSKLWLSGLEKPVQEYLSGGVISRSSPLGALQVDPNYSTHVELLRNTGKPVASIPTALVKPVNRTGTAWIYNVQANVPADQQHIVINTPYRPDDGVVHPNLIHVPDKFLGYEYLLAITPYTAMNDQEENPCLYGSNDLVTFTLLPNVEQPIDDTPANTEGRPGYLSDPFWGYNSFTGELMCCYRKTYVIDGSGASNDLFLLLYRSTKDGQTWGEPTILLDEKVGSQDLILSPSIVYNANEGKWYLFYFIRDDVMVYRTNKTLNPSTWSEPVNCGFSASLGYRGWHLEVKFVGNRLVCLINDYRQTANIYLGISDPDDWSKWEFSRTPLLNKPGNKRGAYKSSFVPNFNGEGKVNLTVAWTTGDLTRNLFINQTNYFDAGK